MHLLFLLLPVKCTSNFQKRRPHRWHGVGTDMWHKKRRPSLPLDHLSQGLELWKKWTYCSLDFSREQSKKRDLWSLSASSPVRLFSRFLCGEQLTQDFAFPTAHTPLDAWRKPFYNRPSDCCFRFAYSVALLIPITKRPSHPRASAW